MFSLIKKWLFGETIDPSPYLEAGALVVDVRTPAEYAAGHPQGAVNIPLSEIKNHFAELRSQNKVIITCCRSGARSGRAAKLLRAQQIEAYNGGAWQRVEEKITA